MVDANTRQEHIDYIQSTHRAFHQQYNQRTTLATLDTFTQLSNKLLHKVTRLYGIKSSAFIVTIKDGMKMRMGPVAMKPSRAHPG